MSTRGLNGPKLAPITDGGLTAAPVPPRIEPPKWLGCMRRASVGYVRKISRTRPATTCWTTCSTRPLKVVAGGKIEEIAEPLQGRHNSP